MPRALPVVLLLTWLVLPATSRSDIDLWPLLKISPESTTVLYPLYHREGKFLMLFPFFYRTNEGQDQHLLWPFVKVSKGRLSRVLPVWFSREPGEYTLLPIFRWTPREIFWPLPPVYLQRDGGFRLIAPLYAKRGDTEVVPPFFYRVREEGRPTRMGAWPILEYKGLAERKSVDFLRFLRADWGQERFAFRLWPLFSWRRDKDLRSVWLIPFQYERSDKHFDLALYPVFARRQDEETSGFWLAPFLYASSSKGFKMTFVGLFDMRRRSIAGTEDIHTSFTVLGFRNLSVFRRQAVTSADGKLLERKRRFLIFSDELDASGKRSLKILGKSLVSRKP